MADNFEVAESSSEDALSEQARHEVVTAQLRGEAKAAGQGPDAVVAAVAAELEALGLEPNASELHRRYGEIDPDVPVLADAEDDSSPGAPEAPADADGPVSAGLDASGDHSPVDEGGGGPAPR